MSDSWFMHLPGGITILAVDTRTVPSLFDAMSTKEATLAHDGLGLSPPMRRTKETLRAAVLSVHGQPPGQMDSRFETLNVTVQSPVIGHPETLTTAQLAAVLRCSARTALRRAERAQVTRLAPNTWTAEGAATIAQHGRRAAAPPSFIEHLPDGRLSTDMARRSVPARTTASPRPPHPRTV